MSATAAAAQPDRPPRAPGHDPDPWPAPAAAGPVDAVVRLPGSKSLTNRFLVLAALGGEVSRIRAPLRSRDTLLMADALRRLGTRLIDHDGDAPEGADWVVEPGPLSGNTHIDCGLAGTVMRFLPAVAALADGPVAFDGDAQARHRPMTVGLDALRQLGVHVDAVGAGLPFTVHGQGAVRGGQVRLDASQSSQFVSGLLLAGARFEQGLTVVHEGPPIPSEPHVTMTVEVLRDAGVDVDDSEPARWRVEPTQIHALDVQVEPDLSNAAPFLAAAMVTGGRVEVPDWPQYTTQAGDALRHILDAMGGQVVLAREGLTVHGPATICGVELDLHAAGELTPVVAALATLADGPSLLRGIGHLRGHETDRLAALQIELQRLGAGVDVLDDGLRITPGQLRPARLRTYADHRMAMAAAVCGLSVPGVTVEDIGTTAKTLPAFTARWTAMLTGRRDRS